MLSQMFSSLGWKLVNSFNFIEGHFSGKLKQNIQEKPNQLITEEAFRLWQRRGMLTVIFAVFL